MVLQEVGETVDVESETTEVSACRHLPGALAIVVSSGFQSIAAAAARFNIPLFVWSSEDTSELRRFLQASI